ncbi:peptide ABC transporter substrate-binding protein [Paenibacillus sp. PK3_47]|uniref:peptide ABC transporter substrate-binding protein n=1 Tax=Paenibacillus sp. PK3_47 TaxID=2072642 RepID=UPI00201DDB5F|nr:peptide ABC transporter substrate-binding protein [Paenibacillus sp. PK3_47]UQZ36784.1 peptide ABC transporter substrate-binding protein [Paenibacillus sp. PK3_47]
MKRLLSWLLAASLLVGITVIPGNTAAAAAAKQVLRIGYEVLPGSVDPAKSSDDAASTLVKGLFEGLVRQDRSGKVIPGMAKSWKVSADGRTYTFNLRSSAKWSNQDSVKASDFEYAWKRALAPETGSTYAFNMYDIANAEAYNTGKLKDASKVGVKALDSYTLQVTLKEKTAYFLQMLAEDIFAPVNAAVVKADKNWALSSKTMVTNGPFTVKSWSSNTITLAKNPKYYAAVEIRLSEVQLLRPKAGTENTTVAYQKNQIDWVGGKEALVYSDLTEASRKQIAEMPYSSTYYYQFNVHEAPFDNVKIRKALAMAVDREALIFGTPAYGFIPPAITGNGLNYRRQVADTSYFKENVAQAKKLLQEGLKEEGLSELPEFSIIVNEEGGHDLVAFSVISDWNKNLGIEAGLEFQPWQQLLSNRYSQNYTIARAGWGADYNDPSAMLGIFTSESPDNDSGWSSPQYDSYVAQAKAVSDPAKRNALYAKAEKLLIDDMVILPLYYYVADVLHKPEVKNVYLDYDGNIIFSRGYIQ